MTRKLVLIVAAFLSVTLFGGCADSGCIKICDDGVNCPMWENPPLGRYYVADAMEWRDHDTRQPVGYAVFFRSAVWWPTRWCAVTGGREMFPPTPPDNNR